MNDKEVESTAKFGPELQKIKIKEDEIKRKKKEKRKKKIDSKKYIILLSVIIVTSIIVILVSKYLENSKYAAYERYEAKMDMYGYSKAYNNEKPTTRENVTKIELLKAIVCTIYNNPSPSVIKKEQFYYDGEEYVQFFETRGVINTLEITRDDLDDEITYIEAVRLMKKAIDILLQGKTISKLSDTDKINLEQYSTEDQAILLDLVASGIIEINVNVHNDIMKKGELNEMIINIAEKFNTITTTGKYISNNKENKPKNDNEYPYTVDTVDKDTYEIPKVKNGLESDIYTPAELYSFAKNNYYQIENWFNSYFNTILNVDYQTIDEETFKTELRKYVILDLDASDEEVARYVEHVKANKIKIEGSAEFQEPIVYKDGFYYRVRMKIQFKIISSDTDINILFNDTRYGMSYKYPSKEYSFVIDAQGKKAITDSNDNIFVAPNVTKSLIVSQGIDIKMLED